MDLLNNLALGFGVALTPANVGFAFIGAMVGTLIGVLPGIGPIATIAMLLPLTFHLEPVSGLIMLAGIFYGAQYGGSTTALFVNPPGGLAPGHSGQPAGRALLGGHLHRRAPDGAPGPRRLGARDRGAGLVLRRHGG